MPTRLVTHPGQMAIEYSRIEFCKYAESSYYLLTDSYVIHYFQDGMIKYRRENKSEALNEMFRTEYKRAEGATRCPRAEVENFARGNGYQLIIKPFKD